MGVVLQDFRYGRIMRLAGDHYIGGSLALYGEYSKGEMDVFRQVVRPGDTVLDIGANIGAFTVPLAQLVGQHGRVYAFEPQRVLFQICCGNVMLNNLMNVYVENIGIGDRSHKLKIKDVYIDGGEVQFNTGGFAIADNPGEYEIDITPVDMLNLQRCDFIKCDTEGMGLEMLQGAEQTIKKFNPILYIEKEEGEQGRRIIELLQELNYKVFLHVVPLCDGENFFKECGNFFSVYKEKNQVVNICSFDWLCVPKDMNFNIEGRFEEVVV